jgi:hypothetical protein
VAIGVSRGAVFVAGISSSSHHCSGSDDDALERYWYRLPNFLQVVAAVAVAAGRGIIPGFASRCILRHTVIVSRIRSRTVDHTRSLLRRRRNEAASASCSLLGCLHDNDGCSDVGGENTLYLYVSVQYSKGARDDEYKAADSERYYNSRG